MFPSDNIAATQVARAVLIALVLIVVMTASAISRPSFAALELSAVLADLPPGEVVPGGERFGAAAGAPPWRGGMSRR